VQIWLPNWSQRRWKMAIECTEWHHKKQSRQLPRANRQDLTATNITAEGLHMEIEREDYREPNRTKPLMEMFAEWHFERLRNYRRTLANILPKLPTEMVTEKSIKNTPKPKKDSLQMKQTPNRITCRITERLRLQSRITITLLPRHTGNQQSIYI